MRRSRNPSAFAAAALLLLVPGGCGDRGGAAAGGGEGDREGGVAAGDGGQATWEDGGAGGAPVVDASIADAASPPPGARTLADFIGISSSTRGGDVGTSTEAERSDLVRQVAGLGVHRVRVDFTFSNIEPRRGAWSFAGYDAFVGDAAASGVDVLAILDYGAAWANPVAYAPAGDGHAPPDRLADFSTFATTVAARYAGTIHAYEIWNEPNNGGSFWHAATQAGSSSTFDDAPRATNTGTYGDPGLFAQLATAATEAIHGLPLGADAPLVAPGGCVFLWEPPVPGVAGNNSAPDFMKAAFAAGAELGNAADVGALHAYTAYPPDSPPESSSFEWGTTNVPIGTKLAEMRATFTAGGLAAAKPAWITEVGWPDRNGVDEGTQARWIVRAIVLAALEGADLLYLYDMYDSAVNADTSALDPEPEPYFGLLHVDGTPKASYLAIQRLVSLLGGYHVTARVTTNDPHGTVYVVGLAGGSGRQAWIAWDSNEAGSGYAWPLPANTTCSDMTGAACALADGAVPVTPAPVYVIGN